LRPDEAPSAQRTERRWLPVVAVVAVIVFAADGANLVSRAIEGPPIDVAGVALHPRAGWAVQHRDDEATVHHLLLAGGSTALDVVVLDGYDGTAATLSEEYATRVLRGQLDRLTIGDPETGRLDSGTSTVRFGYVGITHDGLAVEGVVTTAVGRSGTGVVFDGYAPKGDLASAVGDLAAMIGSAEVP